MQKHILCKKKKIYIFKNYKKKKNAVKQKLLQEFTKLYTSWNRMTEKLSVIFWHISYIYCGKLNVHLLYVINTIKIVLFFVKQKFIIKNKNKIYRPITKT